MSLPLQKKELMLNIFADYLDKRVAINNANRGHSKIACIVFTNLKRYCVLREFVWVQPV